MDGVLEVSGEPRTQSRDDAKRTLDTSWPEKEGRDGGKCGKDLSNQGDKGVSEQMTRYQGPNQRVSSFVRKNSRDLGLSITVEWWLRNCGL